jgi:2-phospho-L-lactate guanylyltransferase
VIPFRGGERGKSRLAQSLSDVAREHVARAMFQHVTNVAVAAAGAGRVLVVTPSADASKQARKSGAAVLRETSAGQNEAVTQACLHLRGKGATTATIVSADLPLLAQRNLEMLMRRARDGQIALAPDRTGEGTNAIALPLRTELRFHFGEHSYSRHVLHYRRSNLLVRSVRQVELASDVDVAEDLALLSDPAALTTLPSVDAGAYRRLG